MDDIAEQLAVRDRYREKLYARMTPEERMERFWSLQAFLFDQLTKSPAGYAWFWRRNIQKRAIPRDEYPPGPD